VQIINLFQFFDLLSFSRPAEAFGGARIGQIVKLISIWLTNQGTSSKTLSLICGICLSAGRSESGHSPWV